MRYLTLLLLLPAVVASAADYLPARPMPSAELPADRTVTRVALGSCFTPYQSDAIFGEIAAARPDIFLFMGDNVYARDESDDMALNSLRHAYGTLAASQRFATLRADTPLLPVWDDHDYGKNDTGGDFAARHVSEKIFEHVWAVPPQDERRQRPGIYYSQVIGPEGKRLQIILLDTRFFSTGFEPNPDPEIGRYARSGNPNQNLLGEDQWQWLAGELKKPADLRILVSSLQVIAEGHYWEAWAMMPREQKRLYKLLAESDRLVIVSGDRHQAALYRRTDVTPYPLYEMTSSSLNLPLTGWVDDPQDEPGPHRISKPWYETNYGMILVDWDGGRVMLQLRDHAGKTIAEQLIALAELMP